MCSSVVYFVDVPAWLDTTTAKPIVDDHCYPWFQFFRPTATESDWEIDNSKLSLTVSKVNIELHNRYKVCANLIHFRIDWCVFMTNGQLSARYHARNSCAIIKSYLIVLRNILLISIAESIFRRRSGANMCPDMIPTSVRRHTRLWCGRLLTCVGVRLE